MMYDPIRKSTTKSKITYDDENVHLTELKLHKEK